MGSKAGDKVEITTKKNTFVGTLLPRPNMLTSDITILKLETGYNIGIENKKIKKIKTIEKHQKKDAKQIKQKENKKLPTVTILTTGGTIASRIDYKTGGVFADYSAQDFLAMCPELTNIANIKSQQVMSIMSESATPQDWETLAKHVVKALEKSDGIVITHGTDTMHYTAAALSFLLKNLGKPVILTGSQRSIDRGSSDAFMNLTCSVIAAAKWQGSEVVTCMHGSTNDYYCALIRGTKVRKMHTTRRDAFRPINDKILAQIYPNATVQDESEYKKRHKTKTTLRKLTKGARLIYIYPGIEPSIVDAQLKGAKGAIIAGTALGHIPLDSKLSLEPVFTKAAKKIPLFICTQTLYGRVHPYVYTNLRRISMGIGAHYLADILPEVALAKLHIALTQKKPVEFMTTNIAGEFTSRELVDTYLE